MEKNNYHLPKILVAVPTYDAKNYCLDQFFDNLYKFDYPKNLIEIYVADNSMSNKNALYIRDRFKVKTFWKDYSTYSLFEKLADSHNQLRRYFLESDCEYMLHLESDIFPPSNILMELLYCRKSIVNGFYQVFNGSHRQPCIRLHDKLHELHNTYVFHKELGNFYHYWVEGKLQKTFIAGIGCCLMTRQLMENFQFRHDNTENHPPDTYFAEDIRKAGIQNWVHTGQLCFHWNREEWGRHYEYINYDKSE